MILNKVVVLLLLQVVGFYFVFVVVVVVVVVSTSAATTATAPLSVKNVTIQVLLMLTLLAHLILWYLTQIFGSILVVVRRKALCTFYSVINDINEDEDKDDGDLRDNFSS